jgi:hypothetical protein
MLGGVRHVGLEGIWVRPGPIAVSEPWVARSPSTQHSSASRSATMTRSNSRSAASQVTITTGSSRRSRSTSIPGRPQVTFANAAAFHSLTEARRNWLRSSGRDSLDATSKVQMSPIPKTSPRCAGATSRTHHCDHGAAHPRAAFAPVYVRLRQDTASARHLDEIAAVRAGGATLYPQETLSCAGTAAAHARPCRLLRQERPRFSTAGYGNSPS